MSRRRKSRLREELPTELFRLRLGVLDARGITVGIIEGSAFDGQPVDVAFGLGNELVEVELLGRSFGRLQGRAVTILEASPDRIEPRCEYFGTCGGCQFQHISYADQLLLKQQRVREALVQGGIVCEVQPVLGSENIYGYRNHSRFSVGRKYGELGYTTHVRHRFMPVQRCDISHDRINEILAVTQGRGAGHQLAVRVGTRTGDLLVQPEQATDLPYTSGQRSLTEAIGGHVFRVSSAAFFQVNTEQADRLIDVVKAGLQPHADDTLLDLYCGVGTFGLALAGHVAWVIGVEESAAALVDAEFNARTLDNATFLAGKTEDVVVSLHDSIDLAIVDPPRAGCRPAALASLIRLAPRRLAYVSCNPDTLAADLTVLLKGGFRILAVQPIDMFPQTAHVETIVILGFHSTTSGIKE